MENLTRKEVQQGAQKDTRAKYEYIRAKEQAARQRHRDKQKQLANKEKGKKKVKQLKVQHKSPAKGRIGPLA